MINAQVLKGQGLNFISFRGIFAWPDCCGEYALSFHQFIPGGDYQLGLYKYTKLWLSVIYAMIVAVTLPEP